MASEPATGARPTTRHVSVRSRIVLVITAVSAIGMLAVGVIVWGVERVSILQQVDDRLHANLESARFLVAEGAEGGGTWETPDDALVGVVRRMSPDDNTGAAGLVDGEIAYTPGIALDVDLQDAPGFIDDVTAAVDGPDPVVGTFRDAEHTWRYLAAPIVLDDASDPERVVFVMAYDLDAELSEIDGAARVYLIAAAIAVAVTGAVAFLVAGRLLRPIRRMRETAARVSAQALSERLPVQGRDDVSDLAATMNDMLDRLDHALESQRRLLSDVGHELKTPITIVRGYAEVIDPNDPADVRETRDLLLDELDRMGLLVQDLAGTASLYGPNPVTRLPVDAADLVRGIIRKASALAGATVEAGRIADAVATVDAVRITQAVLQLAQNAVMHGGGRMQIGSRLDGDVLAIWVRDYGAGVPDGAKALVFERFQRGVDDEGRGSRGSGLGLDIVRLITRAHAGEATVSDADGGGAVFTLTVPVGGEEAKERERDGIDSHR